MRTEKSRRSFLLVSAAAGTGALLGCNRSESPEPSPSHVAASASASAPSGPGDEGLEVTAVEDLMREHGVIRRALVVYREAASRLRTKPSAVPPDALQRTAKLLRSFAEEYHEKKLEEAHIFPAVKRVGGDAARVVDVLVAQHQRGREITDYVIARTAEAIGPSRVEPLARAFEAFARMYEAHAAIEDTVVFPAWKKTMSAKELDEVGDLFEDIEHKTFGKDGFDDGVEQIETIERAFGLDIAHFTPGPPPKS